MKRSSGVFLSISSLPSRYDGIGTLGKEAYKFVDFLSESGFSYWQILPFNPTGFGNSPYQTFSTFAGNPYYIDLLKLKEEGLLSSYNLKNYTYKKGDFVDYGLLYIEKFKILKIAFNKAKKKQKEAFDKFCLENSSWIDDYSLFMAIKDHFNGCSFLHWPKDIKTRQTKAMKYYKEILKDEVEFYKFTQYAFYKQLKELTDYMTSKNIELIGDLPIYVSLDSCDVWANTQQYLFDSEYNPKLVAGVPPDYFSETGQLWGNPLYNYRRMKKDNYSWWIQRIKHIGKYCKTIRIDHFRGFESFYAIKNGEKTAVNGRWIKGPGVELFNRIKKECPDINIIAEDLGIITRRVKSLINECGYPGMKVLQFAFDGSKNNPYLSKNHTPNSVAYIGTHDNQTLKGFTEELDEEKENYIRKCFRFKEENIEDLLIKGLFKSKSNLAIVNAVDMLNKDDTYRMNEPSTINDKNWAFRLTNLKDLSKLKTKYYRLNKKTERI